MDSRKKALEPWRYEVQAVVDCRFASSGWRSFLALAVILAGAETLAWRNRFIQDDAFISFRYARNLAEGRGLVWNVNEPIEGYTNFLWTVLMAVPHLLRIDPITFAYCLGLILYPITLGVTYGLAVLLLGSRLAGLLTVLLLGVNFTFSSYATGGLETQLETCLVTVLTYLVLAGHAHRAWSAGSLLAISLLSAAAIMTRPDGLLFVLVAHLTVLSSFRGNLFPHKLGMRLASLLGPFGALVGSWLIWKLRIYGCILPNAFYAKAMTAYVPFGIYYVCMFFLSYLLFPFVILCPLLLWRKRIAWSFEIRILLGIVLLWLGYVAIVGGDFMEFRMIVPALPLIMVLVTMTLLGFTPHVRGRAALGALVVAGSLLHVATFERSPIRRGITPIRLLYANVSEPEWNFVQVGKRLGEAFRHDPKVMIATTAAGAIPYYSGLSAVDILGVNDSWIARNGRMEGRGSGHRRRASLDYLIQRKVHLILGQPARLAEVPKPSYSPRDLWNPVFRELVTEGALPSGARILEIPINDAYKLVTLYLTSSPLVDEAIRRHGWRVVPIAL